jgi:hypothetical protein
MTESSAVAGSLEERLRRLEDVEDLRALTYCYGNTLDRGIRGKRADINQLDSVFAVDARWQFEDAHVEGLAAIKEMLADATRAPGLALHGFSNPRITVEGDTAKGHWLLIVSVVRDGQPQQDIYAEELEYVRGEAGWRIKSLRLFRGATIKG